MGMTEKQGGSDVRANTTRAEPVGDREYRIVGHKWFFSAPMCDAFLILAQAPGGLSCFFLPRFTPDGEVNGIRIQRLKDKLGDRSNASSEVEFVGARAWLVGDEGRGIPTILEMGTYCRLDCALGTAGLIRGAVAQAVHHAHHRAAFGRKLADQPLMRNVLADLALEAEAATALALRLARAFDSDADEQQGLLRRILTPAAKYWICKRGPAVGGEAMEVLGGNGYVEEGPLARIYRQMPLNSIWEGSGNVMCLDVLRAIGRDSRCVEALAAELAPARGRNAAFDAFASRLADDLAQPALAEGESRLLTQRIALAVQGALLLRFAPEPVAAGVLRVAPRRRGLRRRRVRQPAGQRRFRGDHRAGAACATDKGAVMTPKTPDLRLPSPLVDVAWLRARLGDPSLVLFDASWHLPAAGRDGAAEFLDAHIPGSRYFDFDRADPRSGIGSPAHAAPARASSSARCARWACVATA